MSRIIRSYLDVFAWSYEDMSGLDPTIVQHHLPILPHAMPVKQKLRRLHPRWSLQVKEEIQKQLSVGFLSMVEYPEWLANVVPFPKKDGKVRVCVDFRDLNKASPKDDFPLPHIDMLVDSTAGHPMLSFMDGFEYPMLTMETDCCQFVQRCQECQMNGDLIHVPPSELHALASPWPFSVWGIDIIGKISPKSSSGHEYILGYNNFKLFYIFIII